jgi:hypothetical protein
MKKNKFELSIFAKAWATVLKTFTVDELNEIIKIAHPGHHVSKNPNRQKKGEKGNAS